MTETGRFWLVGPCPDWIVSAVVDQGLRVRWIRAVDQAEADAEPGQAGVAVLEHEHSLLTGAGALAGLAPAWSVLLNAPGWGGKRFQRAAAAAIASFPRTRLVPLPDADWVAKARRANVHTREALAEILAALGLAPGAGAGAMGAAAVGVRRG